MTKKKLTITLFILMNICCLAFGVNVRSINLEFVTIGNAGNLGDNRSDVYVTGCGAVAYKYKIGKYEISNAQWATFINLSGAPTGYPIDSYNQSTYWKGDNLPTSSISWYEAVQFCNYLTSGDKSKGVYKFNGNNANPNEFIEIDRTSAEATYGVIYFLPNIDEWYKAAYYKPDGSGYTTFANGTNLMPSKSEACYGQHFTYTGPWDIGTGIEEQNGTFDMMGNIWEWNETVVIDGYYRNMSGGAYFWEGMSMASSSSGSVSSLNTEFSYSGFRVASIPEPTTIFLFGMCLAIIKTKI